MFTFDERVKKMLFTVSSEFRKLARKSVHPYEVELPYMNSMSLLFFNLATMDKPFSELEEYCKQTIEGVNKAALSYVKKLGGEKAETAEQSEGNKEFTIGFHYALEGSGERFSDTFTCNAPSWVDAVNKWIEHCYSNGYRGFAINYARPMDI